MTASAIAKSHFAAAMAQAAAEGQDMDAVARQFLSLVVQTFRERRSAQDARAELLEAANHCEADEDFMFMRP
jgi:hypothetical protein